MFHVKHIKKGCETMKAIKNYIGDFLTLVFIGVVSAAIGSLMVLTAPAVALFTSLLDN